MKEELLTKYVNLLERLLWRLENHINRMDTKLTELRFGIHD